MIAALAIARADSAAPFRYVWGTAFHILPETHSDESGYFSLCEGRDGKIYVGTAKYNVNSYLVEFEPVSGQQRVVIDTQKVAGATGTGYAAQSKIHTRNFVGPSGRIYCGSKQGYRLKGDTAEYPGGYLLTYDPKTRMAQSLGMPFPGKGVIDVAADEERGLIYVVTCDDEHGDQRWMRYDVAAGKYEELGPLLTPYATTLISPDGRASAITADFQLAQYDPATGRVAVRDILLDGSKWQRRDANSIPTWIIAPDGVTAYLLLMNDPTLLTISLRSDARVSSAPTASAARTASAAARSHGRLIDGRNPDSRCALTLAPDGQVYALVRVDNETGFGTGYLHHLVRFNPADQSRTDLGVIAVKNPEFFDFAPRADGSRPPFSHGYHTLPDGTLTPLHAHMALIAASDGALYVTIIYPFTLLRIAGLK